jgi:hypothetical protein
MFRRDNASHGFFSVVPVSVETCVQFCDAICISSRKCHAIGSGNVRFQKFSSLSPFIESLIRIKDGLLNC